MTSRKLNYKWDKKQIEGLPKLKLPSSIPLPSACSLQSQMGPVRDQGDIGSCTSFGVGGAFEFCRLKEKKKGDFVPSHLFIYYNGRKIENDPLSEDTGLSCSDACKSGALFGTCHEKLWPYCDANLPLQPPPACYKQALDYKVKLYQPVQQNAQTVKGVLSSGFPIIYGIQVYESFMTSEVATSGIVPTPNVNTEQLMGGHCTLLCGYDDDSQHFTAMNSWGTSWGMKGFFKINYNYVLDSNLAGDFWVIKEV